MKSKAAIMMFLVVGSVISASAVDQEKPLVLDYFETDRVIETGIPVKFYLTVYDEDNTSLELNVTLFFSDDSFEQVNDSVIMLFADGIDNNTYRFERDIVKGEDTCLEYYYQVTDGNYTVRKPEIDNLQINWTTPAFTLTKTIEYERVLPDQANMLASLIFLTVIGAFILVAISKRQRSDK